MELKLKCFLQVSEGFSGKAAELSALPSAEPQEPDKASSEQLPLDRHMRTLLVVESSRQGEVSRGKRKSLCMEMSEKGR